MMPRTVLVVDDSSLARRTCRAILEAEGYLVLEAPDGMTALERYYIDRPDLVLLDLVMKGMYGLDVLGKLREMDEDVRVVVVSADIQDSSREMVQAAGGRAFVSKPFDRAELLKAVESALGRSG
jgi:two-component system, chemotaxis family, chemotaxis protein CheY